MRIENDGITILSDGGVFATVYNEARPRPYVWPLYTPAGVPVTRDFPMSERAGEQHDHPHHQSLWFAHGDVDGFDFWHGKGHRERLEHEATYASVGVHPHVVVRSEYRWTVDEDRVLLRESRELRFEEHGDHRSIDVEVTLRAGDADVTLGDTKEGTFAMRLHPALRVDGEVATGTLRNSEGQSGKAAWGRRARWLHDHGVVDGARVGVVMLDHPDNLRHPTWWHARNYGLIAANPFGLHDFERKPDGTGDFVLRRGEPLVLRYRVIVYDGAWSEERVDAAWSAWAQR
ncbi:MAG: PmoA family protein [Planctomycetes bacterium]|nr:PmoA family protein [Planctomycetota bacterium]